MRRTGIKIATITKFSVSLTRYFFLFSRSFPGMLPVRTHPLSKKKKKTLVVRGRNWAGRQDCDASQEGGRRTRGEKDVRAAKDAEKSRFCLIVQKALCKKKNLV